MALGVASVLGMWMAGAMETRSAEDTDPVGLWERWEVGFTSDAGADPDTELLVEFEAPGGGTRIVPGFWDGGHSWRVRFMPDRTGEWRYRTRARPASSGMDGIEGAFRCVRGAANDRFRRHGAIRVSPSGLHFEHADGTPFLWIVDTAWNGALKSTPDDWDRYLDNRVSNGFTGVQFVITQWRTAYTNAEGQVAYDGFDRIRIHPEFFRRIDDRVDAVNARGLLAVPVLLWTLGQKQHNPGQLPESQAIRLARYMVARYSANHVAFFLPGDGRYFDENAERWKRIGRAVFDREPHPPVFLHPQGMQWPYEAFLSEKWVSAFGYQSGHGDDDRTLEWLHSGPPSEKWTREPQRPVINLEPPYEDHIAYQSRQRHTADTVRRTLYWSLLNAPTAGTSYGAHGVWSWETAPAEPQEHRGTGVARPWFEAMELPGSRQVGHLVRLLGSIRWWTLRPADELVSTGRGEDETAGLTYVVYTREPGGECSLYRDGQLITRRRIEGESSNWDESFRLALANEITRDRPWRGELRGVILHARALGAAEVARRHADRSGAHRGPGVQVAYLFDEGSGDRVRDRSGREPPIDLVIENPAAVRWVPTGGLEVREPVLIAATGPAARLTEAVARSGAMTLEAWFEPADLVQSGPARIVTISRNTGERNFTLGQRGAGYEVRFRTTATSANGEPALSTPGAGEAARHVAAACSAGGDLAVVYLPAGGTVTLDTSRLKPDLRARWYNPRTGEGEPARPAGRDRFECPDPGDWVLVLETDAR